jgi:hypothetical protein
MRTQLPLGQKNTHAAPHAEQQKSDTFPLASAQRATKEKINLKNRLLVLGMVASQVVNLTLKPVKPV